MGECAVLPKTLNLNDFIVHIRKLGAKSVTHSILVHTTEDNPSLLIAFDKVKRLVFQFLNTVIRTLWLIADSADDAVIRLALVTQAT